MNSLSLSAHGRGDGVLTCEVTGTYEFSDGSADGGLSDYR